MSRQEVDHLPARAGVGFRIVAEPHAQDRTVGEAHVERVGPAGKDDQLEAGADSGWARFICSQKWAGVTMYRPPHPWSSTTKGNGPAPSGR